VSSPLSDYISDAPIADRTHDSITKIISSAAAIMTLPTPVNTARSPDLIVDAPLTIILPTSDKIPENVETTLRKSKQQELFNNSGYAVLGLCMSGRGYPVKMFLHRELMDEIDPTGAEFENVFWHETLHGIEGVEASASGGFQRNMPWSYQLQQHMQEIRCYS